MKTCSCPPVPSFSTGLPPGESLEIEASLNWLLPDWPCSPHPEEPSALQLASPYGPVSLLLDVRCPGNVNSAPLLQVVRAAELVLGSGEVSPTWGWYSPTYGYKEPALSVRLTVAATLPLTLITTFLLPEPLAASHA